MPDLTRREFAIAGASVLLAGRRRVYLDRARPSHLVLPVVSRPRP